MREAGFRRDFFDLEIARNEVTDKRRRADNVSRGQVGVRTEEPRAVIGPPERRPPIAVVTVCVLDANCVVESAIEQVVRAGWQNQLGSRAPTIRQAGVAIPEAVVASIRPG